MGLTLACLLGTHPMTRGLRVGLVDPGPGMGTSVQWVGGIGKKQEKEVQGRKEGIIPDMRCSALSPWSFALLDSIGVSPLLDRVTPYREMEIWHAEGKGHLTFSALEYERQKKVNTAEDKQSTPDASVDVHPLGYMVENSVLQQALGLRYGQLMLERENFVNLVGNITAVHLPEKNAQDWKSDSVRVVVTGKDKMESELSARLLIGADGANGIVRRSSGIGAFGFDYNQKYVSCLFR